MPVIQSEIVVQDVQRRLNQEITFCRFRYNINPYQEDTFIATYNDYNNKGIYNRENGLEKSLMTGWPKLSFSFTLTPAIPDQIAQTRKTDQSQIDLNVYQNQISYTEMKEDDLVNIWRDIRGIDPKLISQWLAEIIKNDQGRKNIIKLHDAVKTWGFSGNESLDNQRTLRKTAETISNPLGAKPLTPSGSSTTYYCPNPRAPLHASPSTVPQASSSNAPYDSSEDDLQRAIAESLKMDEAQQEEDKRNLEFALQASRAGQGSSASISKPAISVPAEKKDNLGNATLVVGKYINELYKKGNKQPSFNEIWAIIPIADRNFDEATVFKAYYNIMNGDDDE